MWKCTCGLRQNLWYYEGNCIIISNVFCVQCLEPLCWWCMLYHNTILDQVWFPTPMQIFPLLIDSHVDIYEILFQTIDKPQRWILSYLNFSAVFFKILPLSPISSGNNCTSSFSKQLTVLLFYFRYLIIRQPLAMAINTWYFSAPPHPR